MYHSKRLWKKKLQRFMCSISDTDAINILKRHKIVAEKRLLMTYIKRNKVEKQELQDYVDALGIAIKGLKK